MTTSSADTAHPLAIDVAGFLRGGLGLGQAARLYVDALRTAGVPLRTTTVDPRMPTTQGATPKRIDFADLSTDAQPKFNLVCVNAPELPDFAVDIGPDFFEDRYTIGVWAWETDHVPDTWEPAYGLVDEIWVYSAYTAEILSHVAPVPVVRVPLPIVRPEPAGAQVPFDLPDGFTFLFAFDFFSTLQRKNPLGLVEAFKRAFTPGEGPQLLLKSFNGDYKPERLLRLQAAAEGRPDIHIVDRFVTEAERAALMAACDCYVSLHRSEGFGLTLGEAMALGKPVVATGYSANLDFMSHTNSYLVDWELTEVGPEGENYPAEGHWAEPDLDHAAALLREVWEDQDGARAKAEKGRADIAEHFSVDAVGRLARERLKRISTTGRARRDGVGRGLPQAGGAGGALPGSWLETAELKTTYNPRRAAREAGPRGLPRWAALQAMKPYTHHQDELSLFLVRAVREVRDRLDDLQLDSQAHLQSLARRTAVIEQTLEELQLGPDAAQDLRRVLEGARARPASTHPAIAHVDGSGRHVLGFRDAASGAGAGSGAAGYRGFEDIFRGDEGALRRQQDEYAELFSGSDWVLDMGCGRGEFLEVLARHGIRGRGVDLDADMVARAVEKGLDVEVGDASSALRALPDGSLPAAFAAQVVEHLSHAQLTELVSLLAVKLAPGGLVVLETVNPHSPAALKAFWTDTTHHHPLFPEVLLALCRIAGFDRGDVLLPGGSTGDFNKDIYESRDYAVVARTAAAPAAS